MSQEQRDKSNKQTLINPLLIFVILLLMVLMQTTTDQYVPSLPAITAVFQSNAASIQLTLTFFMLGLSISHLLYGPLSDRIGRKPPLIFGVGLSIVGSIFCFFALSVNILILGRFLQGLGIGCCSSVGRSLIRDLFSGRFLAKIGSYVGVLSIFIMAASPALGGYIQERAGWRANFLFLIIAGLIIWVMAILVLPETNKNLNPNATKIRVLMANYLALLKNNVFLGYTLCSCFAGAGLVSYLTMAPFLFQNVLGLSPLQFGQLTFFIAGAIGLSGLINSQLVMHRGLSFMVFIGVVCMILGGLSLVIISLSGQTEILYIMLSIALFSMGAGFTFINAFPGAFHSFPHMAGTAGSLFASMQDLTSSLASGLIAAFNGYELYALALILLGFGLSSLTAWYYLSYHSEPGKAEGFFHNKDGH